MLEDGSYTEYTWDARNRLVSVVDKTVGDVTTMSAEYVYDAFDRRIAKIVDADGDVGGPNPTTETFLYNGDKMLLVREDVDGELKRRYTHGPMVDQVLVDEDLEDGFVNWLVPNHQGSIRHVIRTDGEATVTADIDYDAFGNVTSEDRPEDVDLLFGYTGQQYDQETGLSYYKARYYDPATGRFLSEDPLGFAAGDPNLYRYVGNSPTNFTDPTGTSIFSEILGDVGDFFGDIGSSIDDWVHDNGGWETWGVIAGSILIPTISVGFGATFGYMAAGSSPGLGFTFGAGTTSAALTPAVYAILNGIDSAQQQDDDSGASSSTQSTVSNDPFGTSLFDSTQFIVDNFQDNFNPMWVSDSPLIWSDGLNSMDTWDSTGWDYRSFDDFLGPSDFRDYPVLSFSTPTLNRSFQPNVSAEPAFSTPTLNRAFQPNVSAPVENAGSGSLSTAIWAGAEVAGGFVPVVGEAMDIAVILDPNAPWWQRGLSALSLGANVATAGFAPNLGGFFRAERRLANALDTATDVSRVGDDAVDLAGDAVRIANAEPNRIYSARELIRRAEDSGPYHNFPESFNQNIFQGNRQVISENYILYAKRGTLNGVSGTYEIGVRPSASGRTEVITHRFFDPDRR